MAQRPGELAVNLPPLLIRKLPAGVKRGNKLHRSAAVSEGHTKTESVSPDANAEEVCRAHMHTAHTPRVRTKAAEMNL